MWTVWSSELVTICLLSGENMIELTSPVCASILSANCPVLESQIWTSSLFSLLHETIHFPFGETAIFALTAAHCQGLQNECVFCMMVWWTSKQGSGSHIQNINSHTVCISLLAKIFSELVQGCARLYNRNKTKSCKCHKPCPNFDKFDFMAFEKLLQVYTSWAKIIWY